MEPSPSRRVALSSGPASVATLGGVLAPSVLLGFTLSPQSSTLEVSPRVLVAGIGPVVPLYTLAAQNALPPGQTGGAPSSVGFSQQLGSVGLAVLGTGECCRLPAVGRSAQVSIVPFGIRLMLAALAPCLRFT